MSTIRTLLGATAVVVGSSAALLTGGIAHADTAQPAPVPNIGQQLVDSVANAPQMLQGLTSVLGGAPATPPPLASANIKVPQPLPPAAPGATTGAPAATSIAPATTAAPGITSLLPGANPGIPAGGAATPAAGPGQLVPNAQIALPNMPFLPVPLPQQVSLPGDLASLAPGGVPVPRGLTQPAAPVPAAAPATTQNPFTFPLSALP